MPQKGWKPGDTAWDFSAPPGYDEALAREGKTHQRVPGTPKGDETVDRIGIFCCVACALMIVLKVAKRRSERRGP